jgi:uracil-DNA glycosylase
MLKSEQYKKIKEKILNCRSCNLCEDGAVNGCSANVAGQGNLESKIMFVAQNPGAEEVQNQQPLTHSGKSGAIYEKMLASLGLTRSDVYTTNIVACHSFNNQEPLPYQIIKCRGHLDSQLELVAPKLVITFGRFAASVFIPTDFKMTKNHGQVLHSKAFDVDIFPLYHPAYIAAYCSLARREEFKQDVVALKRILKGYLC